MLRVLSRLLRVADMYAIRVVTNPDSDNMIEVYQSAPTQVTAGQQRTVLPCVSGSGSIAITYEACVGEITPTKIVYSTSVEAARNTLYLAMSGV